MVIFQFFLFLLFAFAGGYIGKLLRLPVGTIIGAMFSVGLAKYFDLLAFEPTALLSFFVQVTLGLMIGLSFVKLSTDQLRKLSLSLIAITVTVFATTIGVGLFVAHTTGLADNLSILSAAPGGMIEMATIAKTLSMHAPVVIMLHLTRVLAVMTIFPFLLQVLYDRQQRKGGLHYETLDHH